MTKANLSIHAQDKTKRAFTSVKNNLGSLDQRVNKLSRGFGGLIGGAAMGALTMVAKKSLDSADKIQKLSIRLGASTEALSQYKHVAELSGVSFETLTMGWQRMTRRVAEAANGTGEARNALKELGISATALNNLAPEKQFEVLADAIEKVQNPADKVRLSMKLFDSEGVSLIQTMKGGSAAMLETREAADALGKTITQEMADGAAQANDAMTNLSASISGAVTQSILQYSDEIARAADLTREYLPKAISAVIEVFKIATPAVLAFYTTLKLLTFAPPMFAAISASAVAMGGGLTVASVATGTLTVAISALKAGLMFLTGPVGIALAVGSLVGLAFHSKETEKSTADLRAELDLLKSGNNDLADSMNAVSMASVDQSIEALRKQYEGLNSDLRLNLITFGQFDDRLAELDERASVLVDTKKHLITQVNKTRDSLSKGVTATKLSWEEYKKSKEILTQYTGEIDEATKSQIKFLKVSTQTFEQYRNANSRGVIENFGNSLNEASAELYNTQQNQELFNQALKDGVISGELAEKMASKLGLEYEGLGEKTSIVSDAWEDANRKIFDSMQTFFRDGLDGWDNFGDSVKDIVKDMIASILAQITQLLVSNAFKKMISFLTEGNKFGGTGLFDGIGELFGGKSGGGGSGGGGLGTLSTAISTATTAFKMFGTKLGLGVGKTIGGGVYAGNLGGGGISSAIAAIPGWGWAALAAAAVLAIGSGARTPQELGEDQLRAVDDATKAGRNTQVQLGSVGGVATSFLGGFDENSTFFGVDLLKDELQKVGDVLKNKFGFDQALALKDGVIRLEDFSREFSANNEEIVAEVQASILIAKHAFDDAELAKVKSLGKSVIAMDRLYDQSADSGKSAADRLKEAYMGAFGASEDAATTALANMGLETERLAQIFDTSSNEILATLTGVATDGLGLFGQSISEMGDQAQATLTSIEDRINGVSVAAQNSAGQVVNAYDGAYDRVQGLDDAFSRRLLQKLDQITDNSSVTRGNSQPLAGI